MFNENGFHQAESRKPTLVGSKLVTTVHLLTWLLLVMIIGSTILLPALRQSKSFGISISNSQVELIDFPVHFNFAQEAWLSRTERKPDISVYSVENHLNAVSKWAGIPLDHSLSFGYSPTMLWLLAPLAFFSHGAAFCLFNLAGLWSIWWQTRPRRCRLGIGLLAFFSPLAFTCLQLGQTALLTGAGLLYLAESTGRKEDDRYLLHTTLLPGGVLWLLTAKPPLAVTAGVVLVALQKWRPVIAALLLTVVMTLAIMPLLGPHWATDYLTLLSSHNLVQANRAFAFSHAPHHMANLRAILNVDWGFADDLASKISLFTWFGALVVLAAFGRRLQLHFGALWALGILCYLLFCPHVTSTEELQLLLLIPLYIPARVEKLTVRGSALLVLAAFAPFLSPAVGPFFPDCRWWLFTIKIVLVVTVLCYYRHNIQNNSRLIPG